MYYDKHDGRVYSASRIAVTLLTLGVSVLCWIGVLYLYSLVR